MSTVAPGLLTQERTISRESFLRGAFYATEHAWHLLEDAVLLFRNARYQNAVVLAVYCLEEVGRAKIYLERRAQIQGNGTFTVASIRAECKDHAFKLAQAEVPVTASVSGVGEPPTPGSPEEAALAQRLKNLRKRREKAAPQEAMSARFEALYVDPLDDGVRWNRPSNASRDQAEYWLGAADLAYLLLREKLLSAATAAELDKAFWGTDRLPKIPETQWDSWDWSPTEASDPVPTASKTQ